MKEVGRRTFSNLCAASALGFGLRPAAARTVEELAHAPRRPGPMQRPSVALRWNAKARQVIAEHGLDPPRASRLLMLLSVAQHDAVYHVLKANNAQVSDETRIGWCRSEMM